MLVKNISARGWGVGGVIIAPLETKEVECTEADVKDNPDLVIVKAEVKADEPRKPGRPPKVEADSIKPEAE